MKTTSRQSRRDAFPMDPKKKMPSKDIGPEAKKMMAEAIARAEEKKQKGPPPKGPGKGR
jgi:hypothetical protein